jgi:hypothetical protein
MIACDRTQSKEGVLEEPVYCGSNPKSRHTPRILFQWASRSKSVLLFGIVIAFSGRLKVTVHPSRRTAFMPYRLFATNCAPRSVSDDFHALKASLDSVWSLKLCVFFKIVSPPPPSLFTVALLRPSPNLRGSVGIAQCSLPTSSASSEWNEKMTNPLIESEWLACGDPQPMLRYLGCKADERKRRLFACACSRRAWHLLAAPRVLALESIKSAEARGGGDIGQGSGPP